jgi:hypothetical protein
MKPSAVFAVRFVMLPLDISGLDRSGDFPHPRPPPADGPLWMEIIAFIEEWSVIRKILRHLNLREQPRRAPPPLLLPHKPETFAVTLSPRRRQQVRASTDSVFRDEVSVYRG